MNLIKSYIQSRGVGFYLACAAAVCAIVAMALYAVNTGDYTAAPVITLAVLGAIAVLAGAAYKTVFGILPSVAAGMLMCCLCMVIASQLGNISMLVTGVLLGDDIPPTFYAAAVFFLISVVCAAVCVFVSNQKEEKETVLIG